MRRRTALALLLTTVCCAAAQGEVDLDDGTFVLVSSFGAPDGSDGRVEKFQGDGKHLGSFTSPDLRGAAPGCLDQEGDCWVPSYLTGKLVRFDPVSLRQTGVLDVGGDPIAVEVDSEGKLLVVKHAAGAVERWTPYGERLATLAGGLMKPDSIHTSAGRIVVGQRSGRGYAVLDERDGRPISRSRLEGVDCLTVAAEGIAVGRDCNRDGVPDIYIADRRTYDGSNDASRIAVCSGSDHTLLDGRLIVGLRSPLGLAFLPDGTLLFTECGQAGVPDSGCIKRWDGRALTDFSALRATGGRFNGLIVVPGSAQHREPDAAQREFFEKRVRPLLATHCWHCHGPDMQEAGLRLDSWSAIAAGGKSGAPVIPGKPDASLLVQAVLHTGDLRMPPDDEKLASADIAALVRWVEDGALWPTGDSTSKGPSPRKSGPLFSAAEKDHWAFRKIADPRPPEVKDRGWVRSPLDRFILRELDKRDLAPAPPAEKQTFLRRLTYDLIGLPPTPEELAAFAADDSDEAIERVVDRLLASPHYGERWGRHWLDVVRYADTTGNDGNFVLENAYRYRDYVIRSFNEDKPYDQFLVEQLAGDLLPDDAGAESALERTIATGFLMLGPKSLAEADKEQVVMDVVDEQVDVMGKAMLGLTLGCARCHDHKFDPIPTADYYSLAGIFRSTRTVVDLDQQTSSWRRRTVRPAVGEPIAVLAPTESLPRDLRIHVRGSHFNLGAKAPRRFLQIIAGENHPALETPQSGRLELARWIASPENPLTARVMVNRVWQGHFGVGLVRTSDNFGTSGERPSHPELLDWLASRFIQSGWSVKAVHRLIVLSGAYRMSCATSDQAASLDPDDRLLSRMNRRRLEAEAIRDTMLAVSGQLDPSIGGERPIDRLYQHSDVVDAARRLVSAGNVTPDFDGFRLPRRAVYLPVVRNCTPAVLALFNSADANSVTAVRDQSVVPSQALLLLNNAWVREQAFHFARRLLAMSTIDDRRRIERAYLLAIARPPSDAEASEATSFLEGYAKAAAASTGGEDAARERAWQSFCQSLFCLNEFMYID